MRSVHIREFTGPDGLEVIETETPTLADDNNVIVRVRAAGLNRADILQTLGKYPPPAGYDETRPGMEFAGEIDAVGEKVIGWEKGDRVFGITAGEAQAEFLAVDASLVARIPDNLSFVEAAGVPEVFITAHDALVTRGSLQKDETVMIHAVGSGVGLAGLQLAKAKGAKVIGTSRTADKVERANEFGLDHGIVISDPTKLNDEVMSITGNEGVNVILDLVGGGYFEANLKSLARKGRCVVVGLTSGREAQIDLGMLLTKRATVVGTVLRARSTEEKAEAVRKFEEDVVPLLALGKVTPNIDRVFSAADCVNAYKYLASNESFGKIILEF